MKRRLMILMTIVLAFGMILSACSSNNSDNNGTDGPANNGGGQAVDEPAGNDQALAIDYEGTLEFWSFDEGGAKMFADAFTAKYPKVKINVTNPGWNELPDNLQTTIAAGAGAPDVAYIAGLGRFANGEGLEDLLQPPYDAGRFKDSFSKGNWESKLSLDGKRLVGMPWDTPPQVTFYRPDLIEAAGFPSEPNELFEFMKSRDNLVQLGLALKAQGVSLFEWDNSVLSNITTGFFDRDLNYLRNNDKYAEALDFAKEVKQLGLAMNQSAIWSDEGKALTSTGKVAMLFYGPWYNGGLQDLGEDQAGKWAITGLPFSERALGGGSTLIITSQSKNKELAWAFVEFALGTMEGNELWIKNGGQPGYMPSWTLPAFQELRFKITGDQPIGAVFAELMEAFEEPYLSWPFNDAAQQVWDQGINEALEKGMDSKAALQQIEENVMKAVKVDMDKFKAQQ